MLNTVVNRYTQIPHEGHVRPTASLPPPWHATRLPHRNIHLWNAQPELNIIQSRISPDQSLRREIRRARRLPPRRTRRGRGLGHRPRALGSDVGELERRRSATHRACHRCGIGHRRDSPARRQVALSTAPSQVAHPALTARIDGHPLFQNPPLRWMPNHPPKLRITWSQRSRGGTQISRLLFGLHTRRSKVSALERASHM